MSPDSDERPVATEAASPAELRRLREAAEEFETFLASFPDLYFRIDPEALIVDYRACAGDDSYAAPEVFLGRRMDEVLPEPAAGTLRAGIDEALRTGELVTVDYSLPMPHGLEYYEARVLRTAHGHAALFVRNNSDIRRAEAQRAQSLSLLRATLESTADGILVVDRDGRMVDWNRRFAEIWRIPDEILGPRNDRRAVDFVQDQLADPDAFQARIHELYDHAEAEGHDVLHLKDGRVIERYSLPQLAGDQIAGRVWSFRDVTERARAAAERDRLLAQAQESVRVRDEFLSIASHELRTPLTSMVLAVQVLQRFCQGGGAPAVPDYIHAALDTAVRQGRQLGRFVEDLLSVSRIRAGRLDVRPAPMDLAALVRQTAAGLAEQLAQASCTLSLQAPAELSGQGDHQRLGQVVTNLLANAIRYGAGRPITVELASDGGRALLRVTDQGIGIAEVDQQRIFERFERGAPASHYGGLGLGLYIVRQIAEAHGGSVSVVSAPGGGAAFTVELPWADAPGSR